MVCLGFATSGTKWDTVRVVVLAQCLPSMKVTKTLLFASRKGFCYSI